LYNPPSPLSDPMAAPTFLLCRMSRMAIMRVRRTLSEIEIERYGIAKSKETTLQILVPGLEVRWMSVMIPIATTMTLARKVTLNSSKTLMRTYRGSVHEAGEGDDPKFRGVDHVAAVELKEGANVRRLPG